MRILKLNAKDTFRVKAYAGTNGVLLAFDLDKARKPGFLGLAIEPMFRLDTMCTCLSTNTVRGETMTERIKQRHFKLLHLAAVQFLLITMMFTQSIAATDIPLTVDTKSVNDTKTTTSPADVKSAKEPSIAKVFNNTVRVDEDLKIEVNNLGELIKKSPKILLYLDGRVVKGLSPEVDITNETLYFTIKRNDDSKDALNRLTGSPKPPWVRSVDVSVGPESGPLPSNQKVKLVIIAEWRLYSWLIGMFLFGIFFLIVAPKTEMLRCKDKGSPYSLALTQMAFWFFAVLLAYSFITLVTGEWDTFPESILVLLGIAGGTMLGARVIDDNKENTLKTTKNNLENQIATLQAQVPFPAEQIGILQQQHNNTVADIKGLKTLRSGGFLNDILNDVNGVSLHRFQIVVWTLVFGVIFCEKTYHNLAMPAFSATQLALIGISSGTYLGFKLPEQKLPEQH